MRDAAAVLHTAGPYPKGPPTVLQAAMAAGVPVYVDLADPKEYIEAALALDARASAAGTMAVVCAGAFPGLSNVIAAEVASRIDEPVKDLTFSYYTAGLGGSGTVNLLITNYGFGDEVPLPSPPQQPAPLLYPPPPCPAPPPCLAPPPPWGGGGIAGGAGHGAGGGLLI